MLDPTELGFFEKTPGSGTWYHPDKGGAYGPRDGGIVAVRETVKNGLLFRAVSSDGEAVHACTASGRCPSPSGLRKHGCFHRLAARALRAAMARAATAKRSDYSKAA
jgi:hypothetical protein